MRAFWVLAALSGCRSETFERGPLVEALSFPGFVAASGDGTGELPVWAMGGIAEAEKGVAGKEQQGNAGQAGALREGPGGVRVRSLQLEVLPSFSVGAALFVPPGEAPTAGVLVTHGHFGRGKSGEEAQQIAWRLAQAGALVVAIDTPGVEEWDRAGRRIHFDEGAHERGYLLSGGTSALALQMAGARRGLDLLSALGAERLGVTGASGGAVQAFYLALLEDPEVGGRISALALASPPPMPREARAGGCACDQLPGWTAADPAMIGALSVPSLWLLDHRGPPPAGLGWRAEVVGSDGPHSYTLDMQAKALDFFEDELGLPGGGGTEAPGWDLAGPVPAEGVPTIFDLPVRKVAPWRPRARGEVVTERSCVGEGPVVLAVGLSDTEAGPVLAQVQAAGLRVCRVRIPPDPGGEHEANGRGEVWAEREAGALLAAAQATGARGIYAHRAYGVAAAGVGLPYVWSGPICRPEDLDLSSDPAWVHVPGAWQGWMAEQCAAVPSGTDPARLGQELARLMAN